MRNDKEKGNCNISVRISFGGDSQMFYTKALTFAQ